MSGKNSNGSISSIDELMSDPAMVGKLLAVALQRNGDKTVRKALVVNHDTPPTISIPASMDKRQASQELMRQWEEEETEIDVARRFEGWKWQDVLVAIKFTAEKYFGWINAQQSFMNPPTEIQVVIDYVNGLPIKTTCFHGKFKVTALDEGVCNIGISGGIVGVSFNLKKKFKHRIEDWYELVDQHLRENSIYKGKSVSVTSHGGAFGDPVHFEIIETRSNPKIVLNPKEKSVIDQYCALDLKEQGKRTYLFTGAYGNGKTEAAMMLGDKAKALGMTFFYVKDSGAFISMLSIAAKYYSPAFIFMEDIDEVGSGDERNQAINVLLNTLDGAETKNKTIKVLFTTNHEDTINPALRRPGRLDLIVKFNNPEKVTVAEIYKRYFVNVDGNEDINYEKISEATPDCSGAFIAEICKRSVRLAELNGSLKDEIVESAINTIRDHLEMMNGKTNVKDKVKDALQTVASWLGEHVASGGLNIEGKLDEVKSTIHQVVGNTEYALANQVAGAASDNQKETKKVKNDTEKIRKRIDA